MSIKCFEYTQIFAHLIEQIDCKLNEQEYETTTTTTLSKFILQNFNPNGQELITSKPLSFIHFNWLDEYINGVYFGDAISDRPKQSNSTSQRSRTSFNTVKSNYIKSIQLRLNYYDTKMFNVNEITTQMWQNYALLRSFSSSSSSSSTNSIDEKLRKMVANELDQFKRERFDGSDAAYDDYLLRKGNF